MRSLSFNSFASIREADALFRPPIWNEPRIGYGTSPVSETRVISERSGASKTLMCTTSPGAIGPSESPPIEALDEADAAEDDPLPPCARGLIAGGCSCATPRHGPISRREVRTGMCFLNAIFLL